MDDKFWHDLSEVNEYNTAAVQLEATLRSAAPLLSLSVDLVTVNDLAFYHRMRSFTIRGYFSLNGHKIGVSQTITREFLDLASIDPAPMICERFANHIAREIVEWKPE